MKITLILVSVALIFGIRFLPLQKPQMQCLKSWFILAIEISVIVAFERWKLLFSFNNFHPFLLLLAPFLGHFLFFNSLLINRLSLQNALKYSLPVVHLFKFYAARPNLLKHYAFISLREELLWRATIQYVLGNSPIAIVFTALLFTATHIRSSKIHLLELFEFMLFSLFLGFAFWRYENLLFVIVIHIIRNMNLSFYYK